MLDRCISENLNQSNSLIIVRTSRRCFQFGTLHSLNTLCMWCTCTAPCWLPAWILRPGSPPGAGTIVSGTRPSYQRNPEHRHIHREKILNRGFAKFVLLTLDLTFYILTSGNKLIVNVVTVDQSASSHHEGFNQSASMTKARVNMNNVVYK